MKRIGDAEGRTPMDRKCVDLGISRLELSRRSGVPARTLEDWAMRKRKSPDVYQLLKVARVLGCSIEDLLEPERYGESRYQAPEEASGETE